MMDVFKARKLANQIRRSLLEWCERIEIAGSIRRGQAEVGDIDFVILADESNSRSRAAILKRIKQSCEIVTGGSECALNTIAMFRDVQLDFFFATPTRKELFDVVPTNFGSLLLCRTGSKQHNIQLAARAIEMGLHWNPYRGVFSGDKLIASETEEAIYHALNLEWLPPTRRETFQVVERLVAR